jgi:glutamate-5-semialdehyde dehydrogenase
MTALQQQGAAAKAAARVLALAGTAQKNQALEAIASALEQGAPAWLAANAEDLAAAKAAGMRESMLDRLALTPERIAGIAASVRQVAALPDPIGTVLGTVVRPNGLTISRRRVPLGVIAIIYEARPNVTADAAVLCLKSGNACILRGGKEAIRSNRAAAELMRRALAKAGLPEDCISLIQDTSHETADELMHLNDYVDVLIPRGGSELIRRVARSSSVPVIRTGEGVCHVYIDRDADLAMGARILCNAKCSRPSVCNAAECVLVARSVAEPFWKLALPLLDQKQVELRCDPESLSLLGARGVPAREEDWDSEYGDYILAVRTVEDVWEAEEFIAAHGTGHSEAIVTSNYFTAQHFLNAVDAAAVYVNASTRFTDGGEFGMGAEIGISTQKLHARGPMGLEELTSWKYTVLGQGQIRE